MRKKHFSRHHKQSVRNYNRSFRPCLYATYKNGAGSPHAAMRRVGLRSRKSTGTGHLKTGNSND